MKILLIYTGGTIGMIKDHTTKALVPGSINTIKTFVNKEFKGNKITYTSTNKLIDSSNFNVAYYRELSTIIEENYNRYDSFLVLMGTDTMSYLSSLLSYCTQGLAKPIVFTGGQLPLSEENSDSKENLKEAIMGLLKKRFPNEVGIYFYHKWMRAVLTTKASSVDLDAYNVPNPNNTVVDFSSESFKIEKNIESEFLIVKLTPFGSFDYLKKILNIESLSGIILEAFGMGNLPDFDEELEGLFKKKIESGFRVVVVSQCVTGGVEIGKYQVSLKSNILGFFSGGFLTVESALAKMMFLSTKPLNYQQYQAFFTESIRGE